jgi:GntR family transcriptional regulator
LYRYTKVSDPVRASSTSLFTVTTGSGEPIYRQLVGQVRRLVAGGQLAAGDELPSVREVAAQLAVNPMTVSKAYGLLETAGVLERRRGLGMVIAESHDKRRPLAERLAILRPTLQRAADETAQLEIDPDVALQQLGKMLKGKE